MEQITETSIICYALSFLARKNQILTLYEVTDNGLSALPESSREVLNLLGNIRVTATNITLEKATLLKLIYSGLLSMCLIC